MSKTTKNVVASKKNVVASKPEAVAPKTPAQYRKDGGRCFTLFGTDKRAFRNGTKSRTYRIEQQMLKMKAPFFTRDLQAALDKTYGEGAVKAVAMHVRACHTVYGTLSKMNDGRYFMAPELRKQLGRKLAATKKSASK